MVAQFNTGQRKVFDQVMAPINQPTNLLRQFFFTVLVALRRRLCTTYSAQLPERPRKKGDHGCIHWNSCNFYLTEPHTTQHLKSTPSITDTTTSKIEEHSYIAKLIRLFICDEATIFSGKLWKTIWRTKTNLLSDWGFPSMSPGLQAWQQSQSGWNDNKKLPNFVPFSPTTSKHAGRVG